MIVSFTLESILESILEYDARRSKKREESEQQVSDFLQMIVQI